MTTQTIAQQKQTYSRELAAYTLKQWNAVRQSTEQQNDEEHKSAETATPRSSPGSRSRTTRLINGQKINGVQATEYGGSTPKHEEVNKGTSTTTP